MTQAEVDDLLRELCAGRRGIDPQALAGVLTLAVEVAREGREGRKVGTLFVVGDDAEVLRRSRCLILDPLAGHPEAARRVDDPALRETVKELAQLDGAFVVSGAGVVLSACRHVNASAEGLDLRLGLGSRHVAAASITRETAAVAVLVSESSVVRVFDGGEIVTELGPER
jgi:DNA integrity scanning protein DisA with diadenylate cyclase activity